MVATPVHSTQTAVMESPVAAPIAPPPKTQPLWRFALIGLGPLGALTVFALLVALFQRLA